MSDCIVFLNSYRIISSSSALYVLCECKSRTNENKWLRLCKFDYRKMDWKIIHDGDSQWMYQHYYLINSRIESTIINNNAGGKQLYVLTTEGAEALLRFNINASGDVENIQYMNGRINGIPMTKLIGCNDDVHGFSFDNALGTVHHVVSRNGGAFAIVKEKIPLFDSLMDSGDELLMQTFQTVMDSGDALLMLRFQSQLVELFSFDKKSDSWKVSLIPIPYGDPKPVCCAAACIVKGGIIMCFDNVSGYLYFIDTKRNTIKNSSWRIPVELNGASIYKVNIISNRGMEQATVFGFIRPIVSKIGNGQISPYFTGQIISSYYSHEYIHVIIDGAKSTERYGKYFLRSWLFCVDDVF